MSHVISRRSACRLAVSAAFALAAGRAAVAQAQQPAPDAAAFVKEFADRAMDHLTAAGIGTTERRQRFRALFVEGFAVPSVGQFILGRYWRVATEAEKAEYLRLFESYVANLYADRLTEYSDGRIRVVQSRLQPENQAMIQSEFVRPGKPPTEISWQVRRDGNGRWRILDVVIEKVSMAITQRDDFAAIIQKNGGQVAGLLATLRERAQQRT